MPLYALGPLRPHTPPEGSYWVAPDAHVIGDVELGEDVGVWFGAVLRGDNDRVRIGARTNIQEGAVVHVDPGFPVSIGQGCTIGHRAIVHGCTIGDNTLIGMGATVLTGARIGKNCLIGAHALVTERTEVPDGSLVLGSPAKVVRPVSEGQLQVLRGSGPHYVHNAERYRAHLRHVGD